MEIHPKSNTIWELYHGYSLTTIASEIQHGKFGEELSPNIIIWNVDSS